MHGIGHLLDADVSRALSVVEQHILLVLEDRLHNQSEALRALVGERLASLDVEDVWRAVLKTSLALG